MGCLAKPRVHFVGRMSVSTPTANNNNLNCIVEPENVALCAPYNGMSDAAFRALMCQLEFKDLRQVGLGIAEVLHSNWNYFGDNRVWMSDTKIVGIDMPDGAYVDSAALDGLIGTPIRISGANGRPALMVDGDPISNLTTQIFSEHVEFGKLGARCEASGAIPRCYTRWLNLSRNIAEVPDTCFSAVWQQALPRELLTFDTSNSKSLQALADLANRNLGLVVRFCTYYFRRKYTDREMAESYRQPSPYLRPNHSSGFVVGTIGPWLRGEVGSCPTGRFLSAPVPQTLAGLSREAFFTPVLAAVDEGTRTICLDLIDCVPEGTTDASEPQQLSKVDLGEARLELVVPGQPPMLIGSFQYDTMTYLRRGGIVEVPYSMSTELLTAGLFQISFGNLSGPLYTEERISFATDDRCVYINEGETAELIFRVYDRGRLATEDVPVRVQQFRSTQEPGSTASGVRGIPAKAIRLVPTNIEPYISVEPEGAIVRNGSLTLYAKALRPGLGLLRVSDARTSDAIPRPYSLGDWTSQYYGHVRVLPADRDLDSIPDYDVSWDVVYDRVLRHYYRLYPAMDAYLPLNNKDALATVSTASILKSRTAAALWHSTLYMPVSRDLSVGKRRLLHRWCDRVLSGRGD